MDKPFVTVIIPCLNEAASIRQCLNSVIANDYPKDRLEIVVMDGGSVDGTRSVVQSYQDCVPSVRLLDNPKKTAPSALNAGIKAARGEIIVRLDAHSFYASDHISKSVRYLIEWGADNVGGVWEIVPRSDTLIGRSIACALSHRFGVGNARYRIQGVRQPEEVDTVPFGCFRKGLFNKLGPFNEAVPRNEDIEFNTRIRKAGGKVMLAPDIKITYLARSTYRSFMQHTFDNGVKFGSRLSSFGHIFSWRHIVPLAALLWVLFMASGYMFFRITGLNWAANISLLTLSSPIAVYTVIALFCSLRIAIRLRSPLLVFIMPAMFFTLHSAHAAGSLFGIIKKILNNKPRPVKTV